MTVEHMESPADRRRLVAERIAQLASEASGEEWVRLVGALVADDGSTPIRKTEAGAIGVWRRAGPDRLVRDQARRREFTYWLDEEELILDRQRRRVVLLGESVARGMLLDPIVTPAKRLEAALGPAYQVVDLAKSNLTASELVDLIDRTPSLDPDVVIVMAGNNWTAWPEFSAVERCSMADRLLQGGYPALRDFWLREVLPRTAESVFDALVRLPDTIQLLFVLPTFNYADWVDDRAISPPMLDGDANRTWFECELSRERRTPGDVVHASLLRKMDDIGVGTSPHVLRDLAGEALRAGRSQDAARFLFAAPDAVCGIPIAVPPRCPSVLRRTIRKLAQARGIALLDMRTIFQEYSKGVPGGNVFLDYCHLSPLGMEVVAVAAARRLTARRTDQSSAGISPLPAHSSLDFISKTDAGMASFMAAIHCSHLGDAEELIRRRLSEAVDGGETPIRAMRAFVEWSDRVTPDWMAPEFIETCRHPIAARYLLLTTQTPAISSCFADVRLRRMIQEALMRAGGSAAGAFHAIAVRSPGIARAAAIDLLSPRHRRQSYWERRRLFRQPAYFEAFTPRSVFFIEPGELQGRDLDVVYRCVADEDADGCSVLVNGVFRATLPVSRRWRRERVSLTGARDDPTGTVLEIVWPMPDWISPCRDARPDRDGAGAERITAYRAHLRKAATAIRAGRFTCPFPSFAKIDRLRLVASSAR